MREPNNLFLQYENRKLSESFHSDLEKELFEPVSHKSEKIKILDNIVIRAADIDSPNNCDPLRPLNKNNETSSISASFDDDQRDADFDPADYHLRNNTSNETDETYQDASYAPIADLNPINAIETEAAFQSLSQQIIKKRKSQKAIARCKFCDEDVWSKNFVRHIERLHPTENEVQDILMLPKKSKQRREAFISLRKDTNFDLFIIGSTRPYRTGKQEPEHPQYYPCFLCKGIFLKRYLKRHAKVCPLKSVRNADSNTRRDHVSASQTVVACASDPTNTLSTLRVKNQVN
ncbi:uncharacterized protein LOC116162391 [Photinus pyralis]|uniref:uncharacterized protein LOC116162391 n=1 Tax=Photinus pyralis TaxID=7054 RepID=UPI0012672B6F|nr:uncharacterized protein LOC116162391 [Photinus pyralis]